MVSKGGIDRESGANAAPSMLYGRMARRLELLEAAIEVIRREGPTASMDEIAAQAGITKPIVYRYFGDRAGVYQAVAEQYCADLTSRFQSAVATSRDLHANVVKAIDAYLAFVQDDPQVHQFLLHPQHATRPAVTFGYHVGEVLADVRRQRLEAADSDNYVAGAMRDRRMVGASVGFLHPAGGVFGLHSHITGVRAAARGRGAGFALKQHQRAWALARDLPVVTWTFDPLVRRNAFLNLVKLGAEVVEYLPDFYGPMGDGI